MDSLSRTLSALGDPTRRSILSRLCRGPATVKELARPFSMSAPAISRHLQVLEHAGLIERGRPGSWRPCTLSPEPLEEATRWLERHRGFWEKDLHRLGVHPDPFAEGAELPFAAVEPTPAETPGAAAASAASGTREELG